MTEPDGPEQPRAEEPGPGRPTHWACAGGATPSEGGDTSFYLKGAEEGPGAPDEGSTSEGPTEFRPPVVGRKVGRYVLVTRLGAGRQSVVWRAVQVEPRIQVVALKVFTPEWTLDRMERVAVLRNTAVRDGPIEESAILPVLEYGVVKGHVYYVMPLIDGYPLSQAIRKRREFLAASEPRPTGRLFDRPEPEYYRGVATIIGRVARGLGGLHAAGLAHCDVKPDNILLDWADRPYLSDFGLARTLDEPQARTRPGQASGTPLYMAREKLMGRSDCDERRCDVYSLGVTLYESATLARPFQIPKDLPRYAWAPFLASAEPSTPRTRQPHLPPDLEAIILRAMHCDPAKRHPSATELADDLDRFLADEADRALPNA